MRALIHSAFASPMGQLLLVSMLVGWMLLVFVGIGWFLLGLALRNAVVTAVLVRRDRAVRLVGFIPLRLVGVGLFLVLAVLAFNTGSGDTSLLDAFGD